MKDLILKTALKQFLQNGIKGMSIAKLVIPLKISSKTFYKYYNNKEELLEEALYYYHNQQYSKVKSVVENHPPHIAFFEIWKTAFLTEFNVNKAFYRDVSHYYPELGKKVDNTINAQFKNLVLNVLTDGIEAGSFRKELIPTVVLTGIFVFYAAIITNQRFKDYSISHNDILENTIFAYIKGLCTTKSLLELEEYILISKILIPLK